MTPEKGLKVKKKFLKRRKIKIKIYQEKWQTTVVNLTVEATTKLTLINPQKVEKQSNKKEWRTPTKTPSNMLYLHNIYLLAAIND